MPESIKLNKEVTFGKVKFKYADLPSIMKEAKKTANDNNFVLYHEIMDNKVTAVLLHETGEKIVSSVVIDNTLKAKDKGAEITYAKRYSLSALLGIVTEEDKDQVMTKEKIKPKMTEKLFDQAIDKIRNGEKDVIKKSLLYFDVSEEQQAELVSLDLEYNA